jgi:hypothetical protein
MRWFDVDISFRPEDHPIMELSDRNLPFVVKIPIGQHRVAKTMIDSGASLNLLMRRTFIEMGLSLADLTPVQDTFHGIIPGQSSMPISLTIDDEEKIAFITLFRIFCYTKMAFGLKNRGATYQKCVHTLLESQIGRNVEAYIDDIVVKSRKRGDLLSDLEETFGNL